MDQLSKGQFEKDYTVAFSMTLAFIAVDVIVSTQIKVISLIERGVHC